MRKITLVLLAVQFASLTGCGCLDPLVQPELTHPGGGHPDPDQPAWQRCLFGTRYRPNDRLKDDSPPANLRIIQEGNRGEQLEQGLKRNREHPEHILPRSDDPS